MSPYNDLTRAIYDKFVLQGFNIIGFYDTKKIEFSVQKDIDSLDYDYVILNSPRFWKEIAAKFDVSKVLLAHTDDVELISYLDYTKHKVNEEYQTKSYDVLFLAYNKSNVIDCSLVSRQIKALGLSSAIIDISNSYYQNVKEGFSENRDIETIKYELLEFVNYKSLVCSIDWEDQFGRPLIYKSQKMGIPTIGLVDGIEDFEDTDYAKSRNAYQTVEYVLVTGENDLKFLQNKLEKCFVIGLPKMYHLYHEKVSLPQKHMVVINVNFTYGTFEEARDNWLKEVLEACAILQLDYIIAQHHADHGDLSNYNVSKENIYDTIRKGSIIISRFSTVISEALAMGRKVVYHNPHGEKVKLYKEPHNAYSISHNTKELVEKIKFELGCKVNQRERANMFLQKQFNINSKVEPAVLAAQKIKKIVRL